MSQDMNAWLLNRQIKHLEKSIRDKEELFIAQAKQMEEVMDALRLLISSTRLAMIPEPEAEKNIQKATDIFNKYDL